jgi:hypothetical protein
MEAVAAMNEPLSSPPVGYKPGAPVEPRLRKSALLPVQPVRPYGVWELTV